MTPRALRGVVLASLLLASCTRESAPRARPCPDPVAGCPLQLAGESLRVRFSERPRPLAPFELTVEGRLDPKAHVRLDMAGMDMGLNLYRLEPAGPGTLRARIVLPVCVQGRADWILTLDSDGHHAALSFTSL